MRHKRALVFSPTRTHVCHGMALETWRSREDPTLLGGGQKRRGAFVRHSDPQFVEVDSLAPEAPARDVSFLASEGETSGDACGTAPFLSSLLLHTYPSLPSPPPRYWSSQALAAALPLCEIANEKEEKVITGWGLITCTVSHSRQPH